MQYMPSESFILEERASMLDNPTAADVCTMAPVLRALGSTSSAPGREAILSLSCDVQPLLDQMQMGGAST